MLYLYWCSIRELIGRGNWGMGSRECCVRLTAVRLWISSCEAELFGHLKFVLMTHSVYITWNTIIFGDGLELNWPRKLIKNYVFKITVTSLPGANEFKLSEIADVHIGRYLVKLHQSISDMSDVQYPPSQSTPLVTQYVSLLSDPVWERGWPKS